MESLKDLKRLLAESRERADETSVANAAYKLGEFYLERGNREEALSLLQESFDLCQKHENLRGSARVSLSLAAIFLRDTDPDRADPYVQRAYSFFEADEDLKERVKSCLLRGDLCWVRNDPENALPFYRQALKVCQEHEDNLGAATFLDRMGVQHRLLGQEDEAMNLFHASGALWEKLGIPDRQAVTLTNLAHIHRGKGNVAEAIRLNEQALSLFRGLRNPQGIQALEKEIARLKGDTSKKEDPVS
jgi:tetratricopeptide (TPR) repeat protein